ncbi:MAG: GTP cyclohydrolase FolE2 [Synergistaceae bacterium]|nr:GTP cyclohydrolase FolE2 [Synergistaceae bacterium]
MRDVQSELDKRNISIDRVGISGISYPITVLDKDRGTQETVANVVMAVALPHEYRGTHMSRFVEALEEFRGKISPHDLEDLANQLLIKLEAFKAEVIFRFPYFIRKSAPISKRESWSRYDVTFKAEKTRSKFDFVTEVIVAIQTLCPCSKEISNSGAHNQRAYVRLAVRMKDFVWIEELITIVENCASAPTFSLLKREDEKFITEYAYNNPRFVEDVVREIVARLETDKRISWVRVLVSSSESIHNHDAFAEVERAYN